MLSICVMREEKAKVPLLTQPLEKVIPFFDRNMVPHRTYLAALLRRQVVGLVALVESSSRVPGALGVGFISTHVEFLNQGISSQLARALFDFALDQKKAISMTAYEPDGEIWLRHVLQRIAAATPSVQLIEQ